ncbi:MAG: hypothetical protein ACKO55_07020, partial [Bacteroidota bacterium]
ARFLVFCVDFGMFLLMAVCSVDGIACDGGWSALVDFTLYSQVSVQVLVFMDYDSAPVRFSTE